MMISSPAANMNVYQKARRTGVTNHGSIDASDLMHYCEEHCIKHSSKTGITTMIYEYVMPDGTKVHFEGLRPSLKDAFVPRYWGIQEPRFSISEKIKDVLSIFKRK